MIQNLILDLTSNRWGKEHVHHAHCSILSYNSVFCDFHNSHWIQGLLMNTPQKLQDPEEFLYT